MPLRAIYIGPMVPLSVLDLSPIVDGLTPAIGGAAIAR